MTTKKEAPKICLLDFRKIELKSLKGEVIKIDKLNETIGDILDLNLSGVRGRRLAEKVFDGGEVEISPEEKVMLTCFLNRDKCQLTSFVVKGLLDALEG